jgi:hypothetical protein
MDKIEIGEGFSFKSKLNNSNLILYKEALNKYATNFQSAKKLEKSFVIFLDTNVLMHVYKLSISARDKIFKFFKDNKERIYLTNQIQQEFIKNREEVIDCFNAELRRKLPEDFRKHIINHINEFLNQNKRILQDYSELNSEIEEIKSKCDEIAGKLQEKSEKTFEQISNLKFLDQYLDVYTEFHICEKLNDLEINFIKKEFDALKTEVRNPDQLVERYNKSFPGAADIKEKPDNPYGDFIIYHEILKFAKTTNQSVIFLTFDRTKGDWMKKDFEPHLHYIENFYLNSSQTLFILDAEKTFNEQFDDAFISILNEKIEVQISDKPQIQFLEIWHQIKNNLIELAALYGFSHNYPIITPIISWLRQNFIFQEIVINEFNYFSNIAIGIENGTLKDIKIGQWFVWLNKLNQLLSLIAEKKIQKSVMKIKDESVNFNLTTFSDFYLDGDDLPF